MVEHTQTCETRLDPLPTPQPLTRANADANTGIIEAAGGSASIATLPWGDVRAPAAAVAATHPRFATPSAIVAADVVYDAALFEPLLATLTVFGGMSPPPRILIAHVRRWKRDKRFWAGAKKRFSVTELDDAGQPVVVSDEGHGSAHEKGALRLFELVPRKKG